MGQFSFSYICREDVTKLWDVLGSVSRWWEMLAVCEAWMLEDNLWLHVSPCG